MSSKITRERLRHKTAVGQTVTPGQGIEMNEVQQNLDDLARRVALLKVPGAEAEEFDPSSLLDSIRRLQRQLDRLRRDLDSLDIIAGGFEIETVTELPPIPDSGALIVFWTSDGGTGDDQLWWTTALLTIWYPMGKFTSNSGVVV